MSRFRSSYKAPQTITEIWKGGATSGVIAGSGGSSVVTDETHDLSNLGTGDCGGPMVLHRSLRNYSFGTCASGYNGTGSQVAIRPYYFRSGAEEPLASTLYGLGGTAIARTLPTAPDVDIADILAQSIGFRQAIPKAIGSSLWKERMVHFRSLGDEYLNVQFGWIPFVGDILDVCHAVKNSHAYLQKLRAGSDHKTRVGYAFPATTSNPTDGAPVALYSVNSSIIDWDAGPVSYYCDTSDEVWFKGCFNYHVPVDPSRMSQLDRFNDYADHVLGLVPTLENIWDAAPWSWAVDWAINVGDVAKNISAFHRDGLVLQYGYIMSHTRVTETWSAPGAAMVSACSTQAITEWKVRYPASPYGFGLTYDGLTLQQKSILAAIGITHFK